MEQVRQAAAALVAGMTQEEKASLLAGADFWHTRGLDRLGLPGVMMTDGPHGLRKQTGRADHVGLNESVPATCFPTASAAACAFDPALWEAMGRAIGEECRREDVAMLLGPGVNHKRSPLCGRNFEYFSEDPYLAGKAAAALVRGIQSVGVAACVKHFACNNQEQNRLVSDSLVDERALREIYLRAFEIAVREGRPRGMMSSYNRVNGVYAAENAWLMETVARGEWGFDGLFVTDWGGMSNVPRGIAAGTDLEMPGVFPGGDQELLQALAEGRLSQDRLDQAAGRVAELALGWEEAKRTPYSCDMAAHADLAERIAGESGVLLKNDGALPLAPGASLALLGSFAKTPRYQGSGSSKICPAALDNIHDALLDRGVDLEYAQAFAPEEGVPREEEIARAVALAGRKDAAVIVCGLPDSYESEGFDREHMWLPESQMELIRRVSAVNPRTVVVLQCGSPVEMPWAEQPNAILLMYLSGERGGGACADLLLGRRNPSGKLAETFPLTISDTPAYPWYRRELYTAEYREGIYTGYRYYDAADKTVRYPFGHGLSYTTFGYGNLEVEEKTVRFTLKNTGTRPGKETAQVYVEKNGIRQLGGFQKVELAPGEERTVTIALDNRAFQYWNTDLHGWREEGGEYAVLVGSSSRDIRLRQAIHRPDGIPAPAYPPCPGAVTREEFAALPGVQYPPPRKSRPFTPDSPVRDLQETLPGRVLVKILRRAVGKNLGGEDVDRLVDATVMEMPLRSMGLSGLFTRQQVQGIIDCFNRHPVRGMSRILRGRRKP